MKKEILYFDMDGVLVDYSSGITQISPEAQNEYQGRLFEVPGVFSLMKPLDGGIDAFETLSKVYDAYILSTPPWGNPSAWAYKYDWVQNYIGESAYKRLVLSRRKDLSRGDYLIDDRTANGAGQFKGGNILLWHKKVSNLEKCFKLSAVTLAQFTVLG